MWNDSTLFVYIYGYISMISIDINLQRTFEISYLKYLPLYIYRKKSTGEDQYIAPRETRENIFYNKKQFVEENMRTILYKEICVSALSHDQRSICDKLCRDIFISICVSNY